MRRLKIGKGWPGEKEYDSRFSHRVNRKIRELNLKRYLARSKTHSRDQRPIVDATRRAAREVSRELEDPYLKKELEEEFGRKPYIFFDEEGRMRTTRLHRGKFERPRVRTRDVLRAEERLPQEKWDPEHKLLKIPGPNKIHDLKEKARKDPDSELAAFLRRNQRYDFDEETGELLGHPLADYEVPEDLI
jgi:hypothetical protein